MPVAVVCVEGRRCLRQGADHAGLQALFRRNRHPESTLTALATKPGLQKNFAMIRPILHKKKVNFSLKLTSCDRGKKENQLQMGSCFIQAVLLGGRPGLGEGWERGRPSFKPQPRCSKFFSLHRAQLLETSNGPRSQT